MTSVDKIEVDDKNIEDAEEQILKIFKATGNKILLDKSKEEKKKKVFEAVRQPRDKSQENNYLERNQSSSSIPRFPTILDTNSVWEQLNMLGNIEKCLDPFSSNSMEDLLNVIKLGAASEQVYPIASCIQKVPELLLGNNSLSKQNSENLENLLKRQNNIYETNNNDNYNNRYQYGNIGINDIDQIMKCFPKENSNFLHCPSETPNVFGRNISANELNAISKQQLDCNLNIVPSMSELLLSNFNDRKDMEQKSPNGAENNGRYSSLFFNGSKRYNKTHSDQISSSYNRNLELCKLKEDLIKSDPSNNQASSVKGLSDLNTLLESRNQLISIEAIKDVVNTMNQNINVDVDSHMILNLINSNNSPHVVDLISTMVNSSGVSNNTERQLTDN